MISEGTPAQALFQRYRDGTVDHGQAEEMLAELVLEHAAPVVRRMVAGRVTVSSPEYEDVCSAAFTALIGRLRALRNDPTCTVDDFEAYAAGVAGHAVRRHFAARSPEHSRLRKRIRYVLETDRRFALRQNKRGALLCCLAGQGGSTVEAGRIAACQRDFSARMLPSRLPDLLLVLLGALAGTVELTDLTNLVADLQGLPAEAPLGEAAGDAVATAEPGPHDRLEMRNWLETLWDEIRQLPERQRAALLLNQRSPHGSAIWLLADLGLAGLGEIAEAVGLEMADLAAVWNRLPLDDAEIAQRLEIERQQVINLRSAARQRLERRMQVHRERPISDPIRSRGK